ncbi:MAG: iron-containing alcohol dehydrogenase [Syntrophobacterales bacterium]|nr:iron-containing alcohol dehydrogenase [Syntrophobacterales bacterium]
MFLLDNYEFYCPVKTNSGNKALEHLPIELNALNSRNPFIIASKDIGGKGAVQKIINAFKNSGITIGIYDAVPDVPDMKCIEEISNIYRNKEHDSIVALGSGSVVNVAKAVNIAVSCNIHSLKNLAGDDLITDPLGPFVLVPTLSGTGYETSRFAKIEDLTFSSHFLMPDIVVIDPRIIKAKDSQIVVATVMSALTHAVEAYTCQAKNPLTDMYAYAAIQYIVENLVNVVKKSRSRKGRMALANATAMAGCVLSRTTLGIVHTLGEVVSNMFDIPHGICMDVLLPYGLEYNTIKNDFHTPDLLLPLAGFDEYARTSEKLRARVAINMIIQMQHDLYDVTKGKIPRTLEEAEVPRYMLQDIAEKAVSLGSAEFDFEGYLTVLEHAWEGKPIFGLEGLEN